MITFFTWSEDIKRCPKPNLSGWVLIKYRLPTSTQYSNIPPSLSPTKSWIDRNKKPSNLVSETEEFWVLTTNLGTKEKVHDYYHYKCWASNKKMQLAFMLRWCWSNNEKTLEYLIHLVPYGRLIGCFYEAMLNKEDIPLRTIFMREKSLVKTPHEHK